MEKGLILAKEIDDLEKVISKHIERIKGMEKILIRLILAKKIRDDLEKVISKHKERVKGQDGLDEYGRPPAPKDGIQYRFSFTDGMWVPF